MDPWIEWLQNFSRALPIGYLLRNEHRRRWIRLYTLPDGKRPASNSSEVAEIIYRYNLAASATLGIGSECIAWAILYDDDSLNEPWSECEIPLKRVDGHEDLEGARIFFREFKWEIGEFDRYFQLVAEDEIGIMTIFSKGTSAAFCPYFGGMDIFVKQERFVDSVRGLFKTWTSDLDSGL